MGQIELEREAMSLDAKSRAELARKLLHSLDDLSEAELEVLWAKEAHRRFSAFERGEMKSYSREEACFLVTNFAYLPVNRERLKDFKQSNLE